LAHNSIFSKSIGHNHGNTTRRAGWEASFHAKGLGPWWPQATTVGEKGVLKRERAIGDINNFFDNEVIADKRPNQSKPTDQNEM
jgi:hypothetical protein